MKQHIFENVSASWVRYDRYEWRERDKVIYLMPAKGAKAMPYDPIENADSIVLAAMEIGLMLMRKAAQEEIRSAIMAFACKYGLLGIITALPTTAKFASYEKVYFPYNPFVKTESMETGDYLNLFFPFEKPCFTKEGTQWELEIPEDADIQTKALAMTYGEAPVPQILSFMPFYAERYDWLAGVFKDRAFTFMTAIYYETGKDDLDEETLELYRLGMAAFEGSAPTYHLELREKPTLVWDFHSLMANIKMMFSFSLTDPNHPPAALQAMRESIYRIPLQCRILLVRLPGQVQKRKAQQKMRMGTQQAPPALTVRLIP